MQKTVETEGFFDTALTITALPPIKESSFMPWELEDSLDGISDLNIVFYFFTRESKHF